MKLAALLESSDRRALLNFQQALADLDNWECELCAPINNMTRPWLLATRKDGCQVKVLLANEGYELLLGPVEEIIGYETSQEGITHDFAKMHEGAIDHIITAFREEFSDEVGELCNEFDGVERRSQLNAAREKYLRRWQDHASAESHGVISPQYAKALIPAIKDDLDGILWGNK